MESLEWVIDWFKKNGNNTLNIEQCLNDNYFDLGYIDSFLFITMISDIENQFGIIFDNAEFQKREFATINGLVRIIEEKNDKKLYN